MLPLTIDSQIRLYQEEDDQILFELFSKAGMLENNQYGFDMLRRVNNLVDFTFVAETEQGVVGAVSFVRRSPRELWGFNITYDKTINHQHRRTEKLWAESIIGTSNAGFEWFSGMLRSVDYEFLAKYYNSVGWFQYKNSEYVSPYPLCYRLWKKMGMDLLFPPEVFFSNDFKLIKTEKNLITLDWRSQSATINDFSSEKSLTEAIHIYACNQESPLSDSKNFIKHYFPQTGAVQLDNTDFVILPPWWSKVSTKDLGMPVMDKWPWEKIENKSDKINFLQHDPVVGIGGMNIVCENKEYLITFSGSPESRYLRLFIESSAEPVILPNKIKFKESEIIFDECSCSIYSSRWNDKWRCFIYSDKNNARLIARGIK